MENWGTSIDKFLFVDYSDPCMKYDSTWSAIVQQLSDGRKAFKQIARDLGISENTVRSKVGALLEQGKLVISGQIDPSQYPDLMLILVGIKLNSMNGIRKAEELSRLRNVVSVFAVTGQFDLFLLVALNKDLGLKEFITEELDRVKDIRSAESFVVYHSVNGLVPTCFA